MRTFSEPQVYQVYVLFFFFHSFSFLLFLFSSFYQVGSKKQSVVGIVPTPDIDGSDGQGDAKAAVGGLDASWAQEFAAKVS